MIALIPAILLAAVAIGLLIARQRSLVNELNELVRARVQTLLQRALSTRGEAFF